MDQYTADHSFNRKSPELDYDVAIVGAGVVGCAMARRLTLDGAKVIVLEKASDVLDGASKSNSAILHTVFDAPPDSLEQACIARGYEEFLNIFQSLGLPILKTGALVLAWSKQQQEKLEALIEKANKNGVHNVRMLGKKEILKREPHLSNQVLDGFEVPGECLVDPWTTAHAYLLQALVNGAQLQRKTEVISGKFDGATWQLETSQTDVRATHVINCAGLYGDWVNHRLIKESLFTVTPRKGQFIVFDKAASSLVSSIILPVPTKTTKGVVVCRTVFGNVLVGPTAEDQDSKTDSSTNADTLKELVAKGIGIFPELKNCEVTSAYAGLRPATEFQDYLIRHFQDRNYVSVGGIRSTGLSASLGIASYVSELIMGDSLQGSTIENPVIPVPDRLSEYHQRDWQTPDNGGIVCHCELVTRREIENVLQGPMAPATLQGLKRRTRVCMGRCQGFYCMAEVAKMTEDFFNPPIALVNNEQ